VPDVLADPEFDRLEWQSIGKQRTALAVPLLRERVALGVIALMRGEVRPFTDKQVELVTTFADQAVIAIENVRLFEEVQARTAELTESLECASSDNLRQGGGFGNGGSGSSGFEVKRLGRDAASGDGRWSFV
jgi:GAF domain-containing protein